MVPLHSLHSKGTFKHLTPWASAYDFWSSRQPTYTNACYVKQLKSDIWGIPGTAKRNLPRKPKNKTYYMKHTKPNLSAQNLPIQTYYTKPSKVDLWTFNLDPLSQFTLGYEVTELWFWDLTTCVTMWVLHNVWTLHNQTHTYTHHLPIDVLSLAVAVQNRKNVEYNTSQICWPKKCFDLALILQ